MKTCNSYTGSVEAQITEGLQQLFNITCLTESLEHWGAASWLSWPFLCGAEFSQLVSAGHCQRQATRPGNALGWSTAAILIICTLIQLEVSYRDGINYPESFQTILLQLTRCVSSLFNIYYYNPCQIFQSQYPSYWRRMQYCLGKQINKPERLKICRINRFRNALAFTSASQETDFYGK